jgi:hypothetical protein
MELVALDSTHTRANSAMICLHDARVEGERDNGVPVPEATLGFAPSPGTDGGARTSGTGVARTAVSSEAFAPQLLPEVFINVESDFLLHNLGVMPFQVIPGGFLALGDNVPRPRSRTCVSRASSGSAG